MKQLSRTFVVSAAAAGAALAMATRRNALRVPRWVVVGRGCRWGRGCD
ncbi:MAG TPA: hypothetical protein VGP27_08530 [Mycobacterium sp.]|nr:hypothetical protein [Mycobacterium sp.]